jgi:curved DNA-binding protein CbpA
MNGQLSEHPLAELIREISARSLSGKLRLEQERVKVAAYFAGGHFLYAASNLRQLRLQEYLLKSNAVSEKDLAQFNGQVSDTELVKVLCAKNLLTTSAAEQIQAQQIADTIRLPLLWTEGSWEFDSRSRLNENLNLNIDASSMLLEAARRLPSTFAAARFRDPAELISPREDPLTNQNLLPAEVFLLSRLDQPMSLRNLIAVSGIGEGETLGLVYTLALAGLIERENWHSAFRDQKPPPPPRAVEEPVAAEATVKTEVETDDVESFLARIASAQTHYDVLGVSTDVPAQNLKGIYYQLAKRYHPDRFRRAEASTVSRLESAFARITQAYETLRDEGLRATYNSKLEARKKAERLAEAATRPTPSAPQSEASSREATPESVVSAAERAEAQFKEGLAALELGQKKVALGLFGSAATACPTEARYHAFYGQLLAGEESTRRVAEAELSAAIKLDPANGQYRVMLAELYLELGLKLRAKGEAERAIAADPNNRQARDLLRTLK